MRFKTKLPATSHFVELTPLVDVVFLLLIFFMITSDVFPVKSVSVEAPVLEKEAAPMVSPLLLQVDNERRLFVGAEKEWVALEDLAEALERRVLQLKEFQPARVPVLVLSVDQRVDYGFFMNVFAVAQRHAAKVRLVYKSGCRGGAPPC